MTKLYNKTSEKVKRQQLRSNMPLAERLLWSKLRNRQIEGYKFRRQYSIDRFVVDFYSSELKLAIELDGDSHFQQGAAERDLERQKFIEANQITFLRFTNKEVYRNLDGVCDKIRETVLKLRG
jgi:very-short-patch-repair endonuclease